MADYVFTFDVIAADSDGYYIDRWDRSNRYEVIGATKAAALEALWPIVGTAPAGRFWKARQVGTANARIDPTLVEHGECIPAEAYREVGDEYRKLHAAAQALVARYEADGPNYVTDYASEIENIREVLNTP